MKYSVGITGGIGSGKSTVCKIFSSLGVPVFNSDEQARSILNSDIALRDKIISIFGKDSYQGNQLNRSFIATKVFEDETSLEILNALVHPAVGKAFYTWRLTAEGPYCIKEAAILFETGIYEDLDFNILVKAPENLRIERVVARDGISEEEVQQRMKQQWSDEQKEALSDATIINDGEVMLLPQVLELHNSFLQQIKGNG